MTTREELFHLAERVEREEPSRELNFWVWWWCKASHSGSAPHTEYVRDNMNDASIPKWTTSLDAAVTLVPRHHCWQVKHGFFCEAVVWRVDVDYTEGSGRDVPAARTQDTPAAALTAAALRALAQEQTDGR